MAKKAVAKTTKDESPKFGVDHLAKALSLKPSTVRIKLREAKIKRTGRGYGWKTEAEMKAVAKRLAA